MVEFFAVILGIAAVAVMLVLAINTVVNHVPLDYQWGVLLAAVFSMVLGISRAGRTVAKKEEEKAHQPDPPAKEGSTNDS